MIFWSKVDYKLFQLQRYTAEEITALWGGDTPVKPENGYEKHDPSWSPSQESRRRTVAIKPG